MKPWETEPDVERWTDEATGYACQISRHPLSLHLCGYVQVPENHPAHGKDYSEYGRDYSEFGFWLFRESSIDVHRGLNFSGQPHHDGRIEGGWWFGFSCDHLHDLVPGQLGHDFYNDPGDIYRDVAYVKAEVESLARQLKDHA